MRRERPRILILHAQSVGNLVIIQLRYNARQTQIWPRAGDYGACAACVVPALRNPSKGRPTCPEPSLGSDCDGGETGDDNELTAELETNAETNCRVASTSSSRPAEMGSRRRTWVAHSAAFSMREIPSRTTAVCPAPKKIRVMDVIGLGWRGGGGVSDGDRTHDRWSHNPVLYRLSYTHRRRKRPTCPWSAGHLV